MITGSDQFAASSEDYTVSTAAQRIKGSGFDDGDVCLIYRAANTSLNHLGITWRTSGSTPSGPLADEYTPLPIGVRAGAAPDAAFVTFACSGVQDFLSSEPRYVTVGVEPKGPLEDPRGNEKVLRDAYATVAHSFSLALAKELGCKDNGGLKSKPTLTPVKAAPSPSKGTQGDRQ
ncbi:hypothetical protein [Streptomyces sp. ODS05-4]|uniref:hypothetical protein n=1 Tax=Streptomyces sp. ODS05-4 TaxID=2944939 RepID=UPI00210B732B|nr:hypothetical protein [Streptomyces sp. ODS05-4]